jgi:hypothetical protein
MIALYGVEVDRLQRSDPVLYRMLWLFRLRAADRKAWQTTRGIAAALSKQDSGFYSHVTETDAQARLAEDVAGSSKQ